MTAPLLRFARYSDIAAAVASSASAAIVASSGMARAIAAAALRDAPRGAVSLRLATIEEFARRVLNDCGEYPHIATDAERRLAMRMAGRTLAGRLIDSDGVGPMLERSYRDVRDGGMTLAEFEARARGRRSATIIRAWREYEGLIAGLGAVDPADVLARAAELIATAKIAPQVLAGFYDMTGAQLRIVHALASAGKLEAIFVPTAEQETFASRFIKQLPALRHAGTPALHIKQPGSAISQYENKFVELREVCRAIGDLIAGGSSPLTIGFVARSFEPYDLRLIQRFAAEFGFSTSLSESVPLIAHRIGRGVVTILRLREQNFPRAEVIDLLRDGYGTARRVSVDALDEMTRKANIAYGGSETVRSRCADYADVVAELESVAASSDPLPAILQNFRIETDLDAAAVDKIEEIAALLRRANAWRRRFDVETIVDLIAQETLSGAPPPSAASVWVGDVMHFRGRTFEHLFVTRMQDDVFPQRRTEDPLLPDSDRRLLGIREIGDGRDEERLLFQLLQDGASSSIHFTLAGNNGLGKLLRPSSLLKQFAITKEPDRRSDILRNFGKEFSKAATGDPRPPTDNILRQLQLITKSGTRSEFDGYITIDRSRIEAVLASISPTALEDFGECPQKFLLKRILGVRDLDEPERELQVNPRDKGSLDHRILERFYRSLDAGEIDRAAASLPQLMPALRERIDSIIDGAFDEFESIVPPFNQAMREIERRATKRHLHAFVAADLADLLESGLRPAHFEHAVAGQPPVLPLAIAGKIDRVDVGDGRVRIIDYKSGKALRHIDLADKIDRGVRLQLALYAMALNASNVSGAVKPLRGGNSGKFSFVLAEHEARLRETLDLFVAAMMRGEFPAFPNDNDNDFNSCKYCPVSHSCRTKHNDAEKYAVTRFREPRTLLGGAPPPSAVPPARAPAPHRTEP